LKVFKKLFKDYKDRVIAESFSKREAVSAEEEFLPMTQNDSESKEELKTSAEDEQTVQK